MNELTKSDLNFVLSRCPKDIVKMIRLNPGKLFLAGGFIRATIAGEKCSDVDLFGSDKEFLKSKAKDLAYDRKGRFFSTDNATTILAPPRYPVQFITRWLFSDAVSLINSFDFTVCQAAIWSEKVAEDKIIFRSAISNLFYPDLAARRLVYTHPVRDEDVGGSMLRVIKYVKRGYSIQAPSLAGVVARLMSKVIINRIPDSDKERGAAMVITGLLREVDPLTVVDGTEFVDEHEVK